VIQRAADFYDYNKTKAFVAVFEDVPTLVATGRKMLSREYLSVKQRQEIAETLSTRAGSFETEVITDTECDP